MFTQDWHVYHFTIILVEDQSERNLSATCGTTCRTEKGSKELCKKDDCNNGYCDKCATSFTCDIIWEMDAKGNGVGLCKDSSSGMN